MRIEAGTTLGHGKYVLVRQLGEGAQGEVWEASQQGIEGFEKAMVLKLMDLKGSLPEARRMFLNEARLIARLSHPNIVQLFDLGQEGELLYFAMEFIQGKDTKELLYLSQLHRQQPLPWGLAASITIEVCKALHYAHRSTDPQTGAPLEIIHRDLKPGNILLNREGFVKVIDFGIAKARVNEGATKTGNIKGTPMYMAPEQVAIKPFDARVDVYAAGAVLYELCTGHSLFEGAEIFRLLMAVLTETPPALREHRPELPVELEEIASKALRKDPDERFATMLELQKALTRLMREQGIEHDNVTRSQWLRELLETPGSEQARPLEASPLVAATRQESWSEQTVKRVLSAQDMAAIGLQTEQESLPTGELSPTEEVARYIPLDGKLDAERTEPLEPPQPAPPIPPEALQPGPQVAYPPGLQTTPQPGLPTTPQPALPPAPQAKRGRWGALAVVAVVLLAGGGGWWMRSLSPPSPPKLPGKASPQRQETSPQKQETSPQRQAQGLARGTPRRRGPKAAAPGVPQPGVPQPGVPQPGIPQPGAPQPGPRAQLPRRPRPQLPRRKQRRIRRSYRAPSYRRRARHAFVRLDIRPRCTLFEGAKPLGLADGRVLRLRPGRHRLRCIHFPSYFVRWFRLRLRAGQRYHRRRRYARGTLVLHSQPWAAAFLRVRGQDFGMIGRTPKQLRLYQGRYTLIFCKRGDTSQRKRMVVLVRPRKRSRVKPRW